MAKAISGGRVNIPRLILVPSLITLGITLIRLVGELLHLNETLFNPKPGGPGSLVGITWLAPIFGVYFALQLSRAGVGPASVWRVIGRAVVGVLLLFGGILIVASPEVDFPGQLAVGLLIMATAVAIQFEVWPAFFKTQLAYAFAARIPVVILMFFAIRGNWGTHYDVVPPDFPPMGFWMKYMLIAFWPQMVFWVAFTVVVGMLFGGIAAALPLRRKTEQPAAQAAGQMAEGR
ncbi:MAG TPA: hypothetical protein VNO70_26060 [Blastocatellia bacterium]|nr:hypothetical protein [Blastocatellia bacterium]